MDDDNTTLTRAYRRAGFGLAIAALLWTAAFVWTAKADDDRSNWLIPIGAAALSILCFSLYSKSKQSSGNRQD